jgi:hypothetical protein
VEFRRVHAPPLRHALAQGKGIASREHLRHHAATGQDWETEWLAWAGVVLVGAGGARWPTSWSVRSAGASASVDRRLRLLRLDPLARHPRPIAHPTSDGRGATTSITTSVTRSTTTGHLPGVGPRVRHLCARSTDRSGARVAWR